MINKLKNFKHHPISFLLKMAVTVSIFITIFFLGFLIVSIFIKGIPQIKPSLFALNYNSENVSLLPALFNTGIVVIGALCLACPLGIFAAIYTVEYARRGNKWVGLVRLTTETLSGIPSIVYGLFGMLFFVTTLHLGYSLLAGILTVSMMILPVVMRTSEEALRAVPDSFREGSYGLGAGKFRTVKSIVLPAAIPGILSGVILSIGRVVGETAALIYTAGTVAAVPKSPLSSGRTLSVHMYELSREGLHTNEACATAVVLVLFVLIINWLSNKFAKKIGKHS